MSLTMHVPNTKCAKQNICYVGAWIARTSSHPNCEVSAMECHSERNVAGRWSNGKRIVVTVHKQNVFLHVIRCSDFNVKTIKQRRHFRGMY